jgi:GAF domain-containing protein
MDFLETRVPPSNSPVLDPERLSVLQATNLLDTPPEEAFDQLTRLACRIMEAPIALVSLVDRERQFFKSCIGPVPEHIQTQRETPLTHSFCRYVVESGRELVVGDVRKNPLLQDNPVAARVRAYAGFPLVTATGHTLGTLCVLDNKPRQWSQAHLDQLASLASVLSTTIAYRSAAQALQPKVGTPTAAKENSRTAPPLTQAITAYLTRLDAYRRATEHADSTAERAQEATLRGQVLATEIEALAATEQYRQESVRGTECDRSAGDISLALLAEDCEQYFDAQRQRAEAMSRFQRAEISLDQVERAGALMLQAEQALRSAVRRHSLSSD